MDGAGGTILARNLAGNDIHFTVGLHDTSLTFFQANGGCVLSWGDLVLPRSVSLAWLLSLSGVRADDFECFYLDVLSKPVYEVCDAGNYPEDPVGAVVDSDGRLLLYVYPDGQHVLRFDGEGMVRTRRNTEGFLISSESLTSQVCTGVPRSLSFSPVGLDFAKTSCVFGELVESLRKSKIHMIDVDLYRVRGPLTPQTTVSVVSFFRQLENILANVQNCAQIGLTLTCQPETHIVCVKKAMHSALRAFSHCRVRVFGLFGRECPGIYRHVAETIGASVLLFTSTSLGPFDTVVSAFPNLHAIHLDCHLSDQHMWDVQDSLLALEPLADESPRYILTTSIWDVDVPEGLVVLEDSNEVWHVYADIMCNTDKYP